MPKQLIDIDVRTMRGLEIGPLASPVVRKDEGDVLYVDHANAEGLRAKYAKDPGMQDRLGGIVDVDYVTQPGQSLWDLVGHDGPFDYVIASHLVEHIPDMVGWMQDVASVLREGGILSLVLPDKRYCFDINRSVTEISDVIDAHQRRLTRPSYGQVYDAFSKVIDVDCTAAWEGTVDYSTMRRSDCEDPDLSAMEYCRNVLASDQFVDVHCHVFTPRSFLDIVHALIRLKLLDFEISSFFPTERGTFEFFVSLRLVSSQSSSVSQGRQLGSVEKALAILEESEGRTSQPGPTARHTGPMGVSDLERRAILAKRAGMSALRSSLRRIHT
jgi:SAM-dependent methyltransferase